MDDSKNDRKKVSGFKTCYEISVQGVTFLVSQFTGHLPKKATNIQNKCDQMSKNHVSKFTSTEKIEKREERVLIFHPRGLE